MGYPIISKSKLSLVAAYVMLAVAVAWWAGATFDYTSYIAQWRAIAAGSNPWGDVSPMGQNAYGPPWVLFAPLVAVHPLLPKVLMVVLFCAAVLLLLRDVPDSLPRRSRWVGALAIAATPVVCLFGYFFGANDLLVAAALSLAIRARHRGAFWAAGFWLGVGALIKFYPAALCVFLMLDGRRLDLRPAIATAMAFVVGMGVGYMVWGESVLTPIRFAADRGSSMLSLHYSLYFYADQFGGISLIEDLRRAAPYVSATSALAVVGLALAARLHWAAALAIGSLVVLLTYNVGHPQFYIGWSVMVGAALLLGGRDGKAAFICLLPYQGFIAIIATWYFFWRYQPAWNAIDHELGFIATGIGLACLASYGLWLWRDRARSVASVQAV